MACALETEPGGGTRLVYDVAARPRNALGAVAIPVQIGRISARRFERVFREYDSRLRAGTADPPAARNASLAPGARGRIEAAGAALVERGLDEELVARLVETVEHADDVAAAHLRPYALADGWGLPRRRVLELCLHATRAGLLELRWDLLCPSCRGPQESASELRGVPGTAHCASCGIDFRSEFDRAVEATFRPAPSIRELDVVEYCVGGPQLTPHVVVQQVLAPGERREVEVALEPGRYRLRPRDALGGEALDSAGGPTRLPLENPREREVVLVLERTAWLDDAATAAEVTALQAFRDLFAEDVLRPGETISVGSLAVVFTDLRGSTRYYRAVGDAPAFASVRDHLETVRDLVAAEGGAVVKTLGDSVMAVFRRPAAAVRALLRSQRELDGRPLELKAGVHFGPCIAVTLNERLDYFGSTVNAASRLPGLARGQDVVVTGAVLADPEVMELVAAEGLATEPIEAELKGFEGERLALRRIQPSAAGTRVTAPSDAEDTSAAYFASTPDV